MSANPSPPSYRNLFSYYWPLVLTSQMMTLSTPVINAALGMAPGATVALAAYGIAHTIFVFCNAPVLITQQIATSMVRGREVHRKVGQVMIGLALAGVAADTLVAQTALGDWLFLEIFSSTPRVAEQARWAVQVAAIAPIALVFRGLYQGWILWHGRNLLITWGTFARLIVTVGLAFGLTRLAGESLALSGATALTFGLLAEMLVVVLLGRSLAFRAPEGQNLSPESPSRKQIMSYSTPLLVSALGWTFQRVIIYAIISPLGDSELNQAAFNVAFSLMLLSASPILALQATTIVKATTRKALERVVRFGSWAAVFFSLLVALVTFAPSGRWVLENVFGLHGDLLIYTQAAIALIWLEPLALALRTIAKGALLRMRVTGPVFWSTLVKLGLMTALGVWAVNIMPDINGAVLGIGLFIFGDVLEGLLLLLVAGLLIRSGRLDEILKQEDGWGKTTT